MERIILICVISFLVGILIDHVVSYFKKPFGIFKIDHSNPEKDIYQVCLEDLDKLDKKKRIVLTIDHNADLSQK